MGSGIRYGIVEPKKKEKTSIELNKEQTILIEEIVDKINMYHLSIYIRESLICLFNKYDYLKKNTFKSINVQSFDNNINIYLSENDRITVKIEIQFTLTEVNNWYNKDLKIEKTKISNINIEIGESKIVPTDHYNKYAIFININDLIRNAN